MNLRSRPPLFLLFPLLAALLPGIMAPARGAEVEGIYQSEIPVSSRDDERERTRAFARGLEEVLLKLSGRQDTLENAAVRRQLQSAQSLVEGWAYQTRASRTPGTDAPQLYLQINYFRPQVQRLLDDAGIPLWPSNRPDTLVWVVFQDELGERALADPSLTEGELYRVLREEADRRALPLRLPLMDLEDRIALTPDQAWTFDVEALRAASARYASDSILVVRLYRTLAGDTFAKAVHLYRDTLVERESFDTPEREFLLSAIDLVTSELAGTFAVRLSGVDNSTRVNLDVRGVASIEDYAAILRYLDGLAVVSGVQVVAVDDDAITLQLRTGGQLRQLLETLSIDRRLLQLSDPARSGQEFQIEYQWQAGP